MAYRDLHEFITALERAGQLRRVRESVSPVLEITEIADRVVKAGGPALLFENVQGSEIPVLINAFGTLERMCLALGAPDLDAVAARVQDLLEFKSPASLADKIRMLPKLADLAGFFPKTVRSGPCQEVILTEGFSLADLPVLQCWPDDGGRFVTLPLVFTRDPATGKRNCGMYRLQLHDAATTGMHWQIHKGGARHYRESLGDGRRLEVAVAIGADPVVTFAATLPLPEDFDEMIFAGFLRGGPVEMVPLPDGGPGSPGHGGDRARGLRPARRAAAGRAVRDHTGFYSLADGPVFHVQWHPRNASRFTTRPSSAGRPWRTAGWGRPSNGFSCR